MAIIMIQHGVHGSSQKKHHHGARNEVWFTKQNKSAWTL